MQGHASPKRYLTDPANAVDRPPHETQPRRAPAPDGRASSHSITPRSAQTHSASPPHDGRIFRQTRSQRPADVNARARITGARAESAAAEHLERIGLTILGRNVRVGRAEIDLLVRDGDAVAVVEVRTRGEGSYQRALDSIDPTKRARLREAGSRLWRARFARDLSVTRMRFDAIAVTFVPGGQTLVEHVRAAF